ncbi:uncharacterized protein LOC129607314 [Condylostylus longicornis]|uniref:uncharacterized protein LOC129607314 n=1 Tax=Condylostylus longicornis TaxID=2530218 RepID=UPI00244DDF3E|nr:uncharacterized protein LOC129607314 [Condylostylus longicornis]
MEVAQSEILVRAKFTFLAYQISGVPNEISRDPVSALKSISSEIGVILNVEELKEIHTVKQKAGRSVESNGFSICSNEVTSLDHVLKGNPNSEISIFLFHHDLSDHLGMVVELCDLNLKNSQNSESVVMYKRINYKKFKNEISEHVINAMDVNQLANEIISVCQNAINSATVLKKSKGSRVKFFSPWIDDECANVIKKRIIATNIKILKRKQYDEIQFSKAENDPKKNWQYIKKLLCGENKKQTVFFPKEANADEKCAKLNSFNELYAMVGEKMAEKFEKSIYLPKCSVAFEFKFRTINLKECIQVINGLSIARAAGPDNIQQHLVKACSMPEPMKCSKVIPVFKNPGSMADLNCFRPIALVSVFSKVIETVANNQISNYLYSKGLVKRQQYGFTRKSNTQAALFDIVSDVQSAIDRGDRRILLRVLFEHGIKGKEYEWFRNYFSDRKQFAECDGVMSSCQKNNFGVIQGSSLGPALFSLYISSLLDLNLNGKPYLYADDLAIVYIAKTCREIEDAIICDLFLIKEWMVQHKLTINASKTKYILFKPRANDIL